MHIKPKFSFEDCVAVFCKDGLLVPEGHYLLVPKNGEFLLSASPAELNLFFDLSIKNSADLTVQDKVVVGVHKNSLVQKKAKSVAVLKHDSPRRAPPSRPAVQKILGAFGPTVTGTFLKDLRMKKISEITSMNYKNCASELIRMVDAGFLCRHRFAGKWVYNLSDGGRLMITKLHQP